MAYTRLSLTATPGKPYLGFLAKAEAIPEAGPHTGLFTALSVMGTPGPIHSFLAKTPYVPGAGVHTGLFTALSVMAVPGMRHTFLAKTPGGVVIPVARRLYGGGGAYYPSIEKIRKEDEEIFELIMLLDADLL